MLLAINKQFRKPSGLGGMIISRIMRKGNIPDYRKVIRALEVQPGERIFEIGYGPGVGISMILQEHDCHVSGIDFSELMYRQATRRNRREVARNKVDLHYGDFLDSAFESEQFDKVFCVNVIYFWNPLSEPFGKVFHMLRPGGFFCIFMAKAEYIDQMKFPMQEIFNIYTLETVSADLKSAGFRSVGHFERQKGMVITAIK
jgi:cyclopropane fatty-acyl-phospholipid synthase-like methyltransferase